MDEDRSGRAPMFGWLFSQLPHYPDTPNLKPRNHEIRDTVATIFTEPWIPVCAGSFPEFYLSLPP